MNAKIERTKHSLTSALYRLLEATDLDTVTVSQLCKEANINRTTFYKYYSVPSDVLLECTENIFEKVIYSNDSPPQTPYDYMLTICQTAYANQDLIKVYIRANGNFAQILGKVLMQYSDTLGYMSNPINTFIAGGVGSTVMSWALQGFKKSPETVAEYMTDCVFRLTENTK